MSDVVSHRLWSAIRTLARKVIVMICSSIVCNRAVRSIVGSKARQSCSIIGSRLLLVEHVR